MSGSNHASSTLLPCPDIYNSADYNLTLELLDRVLIARLELNPQNMTCVIYNYAELSRGLLRCIQSSDELDYLPVLVSLPPQQTVFEYLVGCWKRLNTARSSVMKKVSHTFDNLIAQQESTLSLLSSGVRAI